MVGKEISPIVTTVAPTIPVLAAKSIPTTTTDIARPPLKPLNNLDKLSSRFSARLDFSSITPIKINNGIAISVALSIIPYSRFGRAYRKAISKLPAIFPKKANNSAVPASEKATG